MSLVLGLDLETTGLDTQNDRIIELAYVFWDTERKAPLHMYNGLLHSVDYPHITPELESLLGIQNQDLVQFGRSPHPELAMFLEEVANTKPAYIIAHNGNSFDRPLLLSELRRHHLKSDDFSPIPWIDTKVDVPYPLGVDTRKLSYLAADHGFINPFSHRALFDVLTMLKVISTYEFSLIEEFHKVPTVLVKANVSMAEKDLAKKRKFYWNPDKKSWLKEIKLCDIKKEEELGGFLVTVVANPVK